MENIPVIKLGLVAVSRDCFPIALSEKRRAAIAAKLENMADYGVVFVGFPVWWYREPSLIDTFMEAYDFTRQTLIPVATTGPSGIGDSGKNMQALATGARVEAGLRFAADAGEDELKKWAAAWL